MGSSLVFGLLILVLFTNNCTICSGSSSNASCIESERRALISFKQDLHDPSNRLASWVGEDCCKWTGIVCHAVSGHVLKLLLGGPPPLDYYVASSTEYEAYLKSLLGGNINPSLLQLKRLRHLDLSNNGFGGIPIPEFLGSLGSLRYLNLSKAELGGMVPPQLGNLTDLRYLDLRGRSFPRTHIHAENLHWLSHSSSLRYLDLSLVDLQQASDWLEVTNSLPSLQVLRLMGCKLSFSDNIPSRFHVNFSSLAILDLSWNTDGGPMPKIVLNMTSLRDLDISWNFFKTSIPSWLYRLSRLEHLNLSGNMLRGRISRDIKNLTSIVKLDLSSNELEGNLPTTMGQLCKLEEIFMSEMKWNLSISHVLDSLSGCASDRLESLDIGYSQISGHLTNVIGKFKALTYLRLTSNSVSGPIPMSLGNLLSLRYLYLQSNHFNESLPKTLGQLVNLEELDISNNLLEGVVSEAHFANTARLRYFYAVSNRHLTLDIQPGWIPPFQLHALHIPSWRIAGLQFPLWLRSQENLISLDMFNTSLESALPPWFSNISAKLEFLDLSHNQMHGRIPNMLNNGTSEVIIDLSHNHFEGSLPSISSNVLRLDLSNNDLSGSISQFLCNRLSQPMNMAFLILANNQLSGKIPNCWSKWQYLVVINLGYNKLSGSIPSSFGSLILLQSLHLRNNNLSGSSLSPLQNCTNLFTLDLAENNFGGKVPAWIGTRLLEMKILSIRSNKFQSHIPNELCFLSFLKILDLASNNLSGSIPKCFKNFSAMTEGDYDSYNFHTENKKPIMYLMEDVQIVMKGRAVEYKEILGLVNFIDMSGNALSGDIPIEITSLSHLLSLNLSKNLLTGEIPKRIGDMKALESIDFSMNQLSGEIPASTSSLSFLSHLNLSYNNLSGRIPSGTQLRSFDASSFIGNSLCGPPLTQNCSTDSAIPVVDDKTSKEEDTGMSSFYSGIGVGFIAGFMGVFGSLILNRTWRHTYFRFLDYVKDQIYVAMALKLRWIFQFP